MTVKAKVTRLISLEISEDVAAFLAYFNGKVVIGDGRARQASNELYDALKHAGIEPMTGIKHDVDTSAEAVCFSDVEKE